jgi:hypothetical protein
MKINYWEKCKTVKDILKFRKGIKKRYYINASGQYLTDYLPQNFDKWTKRKLINFLNKNAWEPLEDYPPEYVWDQIEASAYSNHK